MVRKVGEAYVRQVPIFTRKVKFLELIITKGEGYIQWANRINQQAELANLEGIKAQDFQLMKYCQGLHGQINFMTNLWIWKLRVGQLRRKLSKSMRRARLSGLNLGKEPPRTKGLL